MREQCSQSQRSSSRPFVVFTLIAAAIGLGILCNTPWWLSADEHALVGTWTYVKDPGEYIEEFHADYTYILRTADGDRSPRKLRWCLEDGYVKIFQASRFGFLNRLRGYSRPEMDVRYERLKDGSIYLDRPIGQPSLGSYGTRLIPWPLGRIDDNHAKALKAYLAED